MIAFILRNTEDVALFTVSKKAPRGLKLHPGKKTYHLGKGKKQIGHEVGQMLPRTSLRKPGQFIGVIDTNNPQHLINLLYYVTEHG